MMNTILMYLFSCSGQKKRKEKWLCSAEEGKKSFHLKAAFTDIIFGHLGAAEQVENTDV